jgi:mycothiol system anti-sigma-R factor
MSCGNPHETPCSEVLDRVYGYLDGEINELDCAKIRQHLTECGPCLREYGLEESVKRLVAKHCGCDPVPAGLRGKVMVRIREIQATLEITELPCWVRSATFAVKPETSDSSLRRMSPYLIAHCDCEARDRFGMRLGLRETPWSRYP